MNTDTIVQANVMKHVTNITARDFYQVMTEQQTQQLINLKEQVSSLQWDAGDLVNGIYSQAMAHGLPCTISQVCQMIVDEVQGDYSANTLRIYSAVARFYPPHIRISYPSCLPFWIYRYAARFEDDYDKVLQWAIEFWDGRGRTPYRREISRYFEPAQALFQAVQPDPIFPPGAFYGDGDIECQAIENNVPDSPLQGVTGDGSDPSTIMQDLEFFSQHIRANISAIPDYKRQFAYQLLQVIAALLE